MQSLTRLDAYAISRALIGLDWHDLKMSAWVRLLLTNLGVQATDKALLTRVLGQDVIAEVFAQDPNAPLPVDKKEELYIPELPATARLSPEAKKLGKAACPCLDQFMEWSRRRSPMTPLAYLESGFIFAISVAIAGRCSIDLYKPIYPNLYLMWVAPSSIFRKTTGMEAIYDLIDAAVSHLLLPQEMSPEAFIMILAGKPPANYESLTTRQKQRIDHGRLFASQRGMMIDEASSMLGAKKKDYMQGQEELLLRAYDATTQSYSRWTMSEGWVEIRNLILSILGATTPAAFVRCVSFDAWETGQMARYALLFPERRLPYKLPQLTPDEYRPPANLVKTLVTLYNALPLPQQAGALDDETPRRETVSLTMDEPARVLYAAYCQALTDTLLNDLLDTRLWANYTRLPEQALKIAVNLAAVNWAAKGAQGRPNIGLGEWARAQQIAEAWRESGHRLLKTIDIGEDARNETRVFDHLTRFPDGRTLREITMSTGISRKAIQESLASLVAAGDVEQTSRKGARGPEATIYKTL